MDKTNNSSSNNQHMSVFKFLFHIFVKIITFLIFIAFILGILFLVLMFLAIKSDWW